MNNKTLTAGQQQARNRTTYVAKPGIINTMVKLLQHAGEKGRPVSVEEILHKLSSKFPERDVQGMEITVRAQLSRLPKERNVPINKVRDGRNVYYSSEVA